jgi:hypothetical protein
MEASAINSPHADADEPEPYFGEEPQDEDAVVEPQESAQEPEEAAEVTEPTPEDAEPQEAAGAARTGGSLEREYIVFQKVPLTEKTLRHLLTQFDKGEVTTVRVAYVELHRSTVRTDKAAVAEAYSIHHAELGNKCDLAAVSARAFKERHVEPRPTTPTTRLAIT